MRRLLIFLVATATAFGQAKTVPPPGIELPSDARADLENGLRHLKASIAKITAGDPLLPDVLIYQEAVRYALENNEFFKADEIGKAKLLLQHGEERAAQLARGLAPWTKSPGLVVRGYVSKIDKSVQPYGLVVPASYSPTAPHRWRVDTWFHGRSETLSEINFLADRERNVGEFAPRDTIMLHLYGRYCNASKFAGEVDLFEALDAVKRQYSVDENRILIRGFSMGGASAWHIGTHFAGLWTAVAPGAGFSETAQYQKLKLTGEGAPSWWEQKLWHLYDAVDYAGNLFNTSTVAYNGEIDPQKQAADMMEHAMAAEGLRMIRVVGPQTAHKYHPDSKITIAHMMDELAERGSDPVPRKVKFTTWTLAYNRMKWITVDGLAKHWERARVDAEIAGTSAIRVESSNLTMFTLEMPSGLCPLDEAHEVAVTVDGQKLTAPSPFSDRSWTAHFQKAGKVWSVAKSAEVSGLHKRHGLQGPVDDAFLDSFVFVSPTGTPMAQGAAQWIAGEEKTAISEWRKQFRGEAQVRDDKDITDADIAASNLILWGDPGSNRVLAKIADRLPVKWNGQTFSMGKESYTAADHVPVLIFPNPLNPKKYVVLNSGFTFADFAAKSNSLQTPKLPDWAVMEISARKVKAAGFFNEEWGM